MRSNDPWMQLRKGDIKKGLNQIGRAYAEDPSSPSHIMELGVAYLWIQDYVAARKHFELAIEQYPKSISSYYAMAGTAQWCLGKSEEAVRHWIAGLKSRSADTNGVGTILPLLLFVSSVLKPGSIETLAVEKLLKEKVKDRRINCWPGPIARLIVNQIGESEFENSCTDPDDDEKSTMLREAKFFQAVLRLSDNGEHATFKETMRELADTSRPEWSRGKFFLKQMWSAEFFLARHEAA